MRRFLILMLSMLSVAMVGARPIRGESGPSQTPAAKRHTLPETERLVMADLTAHLKVAEGDLSVRERVERRWPDAGLGCAARKGLHEPVPIDGYAFTIEHRGARFEYHTDQHGRIRRCSGGKPVRPRG